LSFFKFKTLKFTEFNGIQNYILAFKDNTFLNAFNFTAVFAVVAVILINMCAFALALALTSKVKGSTIFRTIFFMPNLVGGIVLAYVWKSILNELIYIIFNSQLVLETTYGFWSLIILLCWQQIGYMMIIYIAGLQSVPSEYVEAARIDGASSWQVLTKITIPTVMPSITICLFLSLTNSFKLFDQNFALTNGSPNRTTEMMALNIYNSFYQSATNMGVGQAKAVVFFVIVAAISLIQLAITKRREVQQ
jgi:raffinose/stachyose/melibiose transport system permease protein